MRSMWRFQYWIGWPGSLSTKCEDQGSAGKTLKIRNEDQRDVLRLTSKSQPHGCRLQAFGRIATVPVGIRRKRQWFRCNLDFSIARRIKQTGISFRTIVELVGFAEEQGLYGSKAYYARTLGLS